MPGKKSRPVRGMNAALADGEAGVGEILPARRPRALWQLGAAVLVTAAVAAVTAATYDAISSRPVSFSGEVTPAHAYYLNFPATGPVQTLLVRPGDHVRAGQVLATQLSSVAAANLQAARAAVAADTALIAEDQHPDTDPTQAAQDQLALAKAQSDAGSAQGALSLAQVAAANQVTAQTTAVTADQTSLTDDQARYTKDCATGTAPPAPGVTSAPTPSADPAPGATPSAPGTGAQPAPSASATTPADEQLCQNLAAQIDKDSAALAQARAQLSAVQSGAQAQEQQDQATLTQSQSVLQAAQAQIAAQGSALTPAIVAQARSQLATAEAQVAADQLALQQTVITAPADGVVADTAGAVGDVVGPAGVHAYAGPAAQSGTLVDQQPGVQLFVPTPATGGGSASAAENAGYSALVTVYSGALQVTAQLPESQMANVHPGRQATLSVSASGRTLTGRISQILLDPARVPGATYYDVTITLDSPPPTVLAGMSVDVTLN
ncbi:HlyD family efflux transporter periplasmic adaptor subunit [Streptacidiphilus anmyonensis]|uniref:HlyD family efflux transporter periplasmic adaptor subunit n=1 Tax=Streptacidiphilus anmyonensis TaxID=405782 RepID=UPI000693E14B|nr:HlyD family efflux transporter periplasmic adaptor subunit [Streptacidiphilus anmyonensis]